MPYTEIKLRNGNKYFYRVLSIREKDRMSKKRIYLGVNLKQEELSLKKLEADKEIQIQKKDIFLDKLKSKIIPFLKKKKIKKAGIFGSYSEGKQTRISDIDILIQPTPKMGFEFAGLQIELKKLLRKKVDLVSYNGISPHLKKQILNQEVRIIG